MRPPRLALALAAAAACESAPAGNYGRHVEDQAACAAGATGQGIDGSVYQGTIDWGGGAGAGKKFAFIRVSDGTQTPDTQFARNWPMARSAGVIRGVYQYFRASEDPTAQADLLINSVAQNGGL